MEARKQGKRKTAGAGGGLPPIRNDAAGIDIGSRQMHVCAPVNEQGDTEVRVFGTTTAEILQCVEWLHGLGVRTVAMESTGVYWIPVLELLEGSGLETLLVDTRPFSRVPGRKSDVSDAEWIQTLHSHGLLRGSFRPSEGVSELRTLVRQKAVLVREQADWTRRMQKCLDQMNVRVHHAVTDAQGVTGMSMVRAIVGGERDAWKLADLRHPGCQKSREQMAALLNGHWRSDHLFNLTQALQMYDSIGERIAAYETEIQERMKKLTPPERVGQQAPPPASAAKRKALKRRHQEGRREELYRMAGCDLTTIDGVGVETAEAVLSEYGVDIGRFASEREFVAHLRLAPNNRITGGKPLKKRRGKGGMTRAGEVLRNAAVGLSRSRTALGAYYRHVARNKSGSIAVFATARKLATLIYRMLRWGQAYVDIGQQAWEERCQARRIRSLTATAAQLGYELLRKTEAVSA